MPNPSLCPGPESNRYVPFGTRDFKSHRYAHANSVPKSDVVDSAHMRVRPFLIDECMGEHGKAQRKHKESTHEPTEPTAFTPERHEKRYHSYQCRLKATAMA